MSVQMTLDEGRNRELEELLRRRKELSEKIFSLHKELMEVGKRISSLDDKRWEHVYEDELLDNEVIKMVGNLHFYDMWGRNYDVVEVRRHIYVGRDRYEVDAAVAYKLSGGSIRSVGFELKLNNNYYLLANALSQAIDRYRYFDYFYVVFGGRFMWGAFENAIDMLESVKRRGIGLIVRPSDTHVRYLGRPIVLIRARMNKKEDIY